MRVVLDTHAFLWIVADAPQLSGNARALIEDNAIDPFLSIASVWEMAIKVGLGKLSPHVPFPMLISEQLSQNRIALLDITVDHALQVAQLPYHHRDPFDRMLIAQVITEELPIINADSTFDAYSVTRV